MMERILSNRYVIGDLIGSGGMAVVYQAWDRELEREVAIKVLRSEFNEDEDFIRRFNLEAQAAAKMSHPNIVGINGVGQDGDVRYISMEYVKGRTLKELIRQTGCIKPERAIQIALKILAAVDCAHRSHVVHRDIKPQNILVDVEGNVKVADFGIARATNAATQTYTDGSNMLGSVHYFSPEQASGQVADEKSDLYSVGVVLYEMITGEVPFDGDTPVSVALKHVQEAPRNVRDIMPTVSKGLDEVVLKALDKEASCRYQTAAEMAVDLKRAIRMPRGGFVDTHNILERERKLRQRVKNLRNRPGLLKQIKIWTIVIVSLTLIGLGIYYGTRIHKHVFLRIDMPNFVMLDLEDVEAHIRELELTYVTEQRNSEKVHFGIVLEQYPEAGASVWPGDRVKLVVSIGKEKLMMPKLLDMSRTEATRVIGENDLILENIILEISSAAPGTVIAQSPSVNEWVKPGDRVTLRISGESAQIPELLGYTAEEARNELIANGFELGTVTEAMSSQPAGVVIGQAIAPGEVALMGSAVNVTVSQSLPVMYRAQTSIIVPVPPEGVEVVCTLMESTGEREVRRFQLTEGEREITLDLDTFEGGAHMVRLYLNGELKDEKELMFVEEA